MPLDLPADYPVVFAEWTRLMDDQKIGEADTFYFETILPAILPLVANRSHAQQRYAGVISLLGYTPETVVLTSRLLRPQRLVVLHTPETARQLDVARRYSGLSLSSFYHEEFLHDREHVNDIYLALQRAVAHLGDGDAIAIELTGGKKTMGMQLANAATALRHIQKRDVDVVYVDYDEYLPRYRKPLPESTRLLILEDPIAAAYQVFGEVDPRGFKSSHLFVDPIFRGRRFELDERMAFVIMPFGEKWSERIWRMVRKVCSSCGLQAVRADDLFGHDIMEDIWRSIMQSSVVIADLSNRNANVFYELGVAHTIGKDFILLTQDVADLPFDLRRYRCIEYDDNADGYEALQNGLRARLRLRGFSDSAEEPAASSR